MPNAPTQIDTVDSKAVRNLVEAKAIGGATILGRPGGWAVLVRYGTVERAVAAQKSRRIRLWRNVSTAISYVRDELGLSRFEIDTRSHEANPQERRRPDQSERLRRQHEAAAYDAWFREQVQAGLDAADRRDVLSQEDMELWFEEKRSELDRRAGKTAS
ncbi:hypothetical protein [Labrys wisconsinensis]|uniref:Uncharacterized protein n=1 Tax=Labrys wisconsinensis TaxID=425677 RepID=A0ABU0J7X4_9HYPH|nr:hypothetical protein [Labrys wisconsinensis]MDQ0470377.1 hypothetical protein [Labrys wisconsinensis]